MLTKSALISLTALASLALGACGRKDAPPPPDQQAAEAEQAPVRPDGSPQLVTSSDQVHIEYRVYGKGEPAVVLVHGWSCDANYWTAQIEALKAHHTTVLVNLAGHGASGRNRTDWSMENYGEDVAAVVRQLSEKQVILVGHSMGAPVALEATRRIGDRVIGIIAVDALKSVGIPPMSKRELEMRIAPFRKDFIGHTREFVTKNFFSEGADPLFIRKIADDMSLSPPEVAIPSIESLSKMDFKSVLPDIHVPVVAINSDLGEATDEARIAKQLPGFKAIVLEHTGHFLMMETPERFNPVLLREIDSLTAKSRG